MTGRMHFKSQRKPESVLVMKSMKPIKVKPIGGTVALMASYPTLYGIIALSLLGRDCVGLKEIKKKLPHQRSRPSRWSRNDCFLQVRAIGSRWSWVFKDFNGK